jgi:phosphate uptake regulator
MGRFLERIADHGVNVGEHTTYIVTSRFPNVANASDLDGPE